MAARTRSLRLLLADDEVPSRRLLRAYAARQPDVEVVAECADGDELERALERERPDLAVLDVRMPGRPVFEVLERAEEAGQLPLVIFASAYDRYAVRAFEVNAVDFLLKPFGERRFAEAVARARQRSGNAGLGQLARDMGRRPERLLVRERRRILPIPVADIRWIGAEDDYARIHTGDRSHLVSRTLAELEARLDPAEFLRIHRSAIVRWACVREVRSEGGGRYRVVLADGTALPVSRGRAPELRRLRV